MDIHWNKEWICGFVESVLEHSDWGIGPFKSDLSQYDIELKAVECEAGEWIISIPFVIIGDKRVDLFAWTCLRKTASIKEFQAKIEACAEEINNTVRSFEKGFTDQQKMLDNETR